MLRFKNLGEVCHAYFPAGHPESVEVVAGGILEVPGELIEEIADAYLVRESEDQVRAWPKERWQQDVPAPRKPSPGKPGAPLAE